MLKKVKEWIKGKLSCVSCSCSYECTSWKKVIAAAVIGLIAGVLINL
jgi:ElaB/YqjD/DUF883 family membrane-anchored ribosome-binding protein|tara:strand:- start:429 stop:569 length:141 start_codon:yes stop_codon:yes gene_type:complete